MSHAVALALCATFLVLALWHVYLALRSHGHGATVPSRDGTPLFTPSRRATLAVAAVLVLFSALVAVAAGLVAVGLPAPLLSGLSYLLALGLLARAIGDFRYVGFFKRVRGSRFAALDTFMYSPLCLLLAAGVALVAWHRGS